jgi:uncharacterized protein YdgA (DUF945 family)
MNKPARIALGLVAAVALAYPASAWWLGMRVEGRLTEQYEKLEQQGYYRVLSRDYQRGLFSAAENVRIELDPAVRELLVDEKNPLIPLVRDSVFTLRSEISHGPLLAGKPGAAHIRTQVLADPAFQDRLQEVLGMQGTGVALRLDAHIGFSGDAQVALHSPAFEASLPMDETGPAVIEWGGIAGQIRLDAGGKDSAIEFGMPKFSLSAGENRLSLTGLRLTGDTRRVLPAEDSLLASGEIRIDMDALSFGVAEQTAVFDLQQLHYYIDMPLSGEFIDFEVRLGSKVLRIAGQDYGPAQYDIDVRHLHVASLDQLIRQYDASPKLQSTEQNPLALLAGLGEPMKALLAQQPEFHLDRFQFRTPEGDARVSAKLMLDGFSPEDMGNPLLLVGKLNLQADLSLPQPLVQALMGKSGGEASAKNVEAAIARGFMTRQGGMLSSRVSFRQGQLTLNGKQIGPM